MKVIISLAQLHIILGDVAGNYSAILPLIEEASSKNSELILFPELWPSGYDLKNREKYYQENRKHLPCLIKAAQDNHIWIGGSWIEKSGEQYFNTFSLINPDGNLFADYSKIHLFGMMDERQWLQGGNRRQTVDFSWGKAGMAVCYDLRFPELFRRYAIEGVSVMLIVAQWPTRRIDHWSLLLRARAIENQMYVLGVNCVGQTGNEIFGGKSAIINPWGEVLAEGATDHAGLLTAEIDLDEVEKIRRWMPVLENRRPELY